MRDIEPDRSDTDVVGKRILAQIVDLIVMIVAFFLIAFILGFTGGFIGGLFGATTNTITDTIGGIASLIAGIATVGYSFILEAIWNGQTVGKRLTGIRAVSETGEKLTTEKAFVRNIPGIVSFAWIFYLVAVLSMALSDHRQRVFDGLAGTVVVSEEYERDDENTQVQQ
jgi:uncharacterized RDD family membrane protein YckC